MDDWIFVLVQQDSNTKKETLLIHGTLKIVYLDCHSKEEEKQKRKLNVFLSSQFLASLNRTHVV
jgi:hypothetical protein